MLFLWVTAPYNLGVSPDSTSFIQGAENVALGNGLTDYYGNFINHWPPLYTLLLGCITKILGGTPIQVGRYLNAFLLFSSGLIFIKILLQLNLKSKIINLAPLLLLVSLPFAVFEYFWTETLFIPLLLLAFYYIMKWQNEEKTKFIFFCGIYSGAFLITRYAGAGFIGGIILFIIYSNRTSIKKTAILLFTYLIPILIIFAAWFLYSNSHSGQGVDRNIVFHLVSFSKLLESVKTIISWFTGPYFQYKVIGLPIFLINCILIYRVLRSNFITFKTYLKKNKQTITVCLFFIFSYYGFLLMSISFFDALTPLDNRLLAPLYPFVLILICFLLNFIETNSYKHKKLITGIFCFLIPFASFPIWIHHYNNGEGVNSKTFKNSQIIASYKVAVDKKVYTNADDIITFHLHKKEHIYLIPKVVNPFDNTPNPEYQNEMDILKNEIAHKKAVIVYFKTITYRDFLISEEEIITQFSEFPIQEYSDGFIIGWQK
ncbi:hypothetical protein Y10_28140 [Neptunitalea sp. Y10]|uniref:Glycosyltransferase RgtA/B/C/D-like domain-containing protein n=2 Tax=Neptunitalea lumnitzerae TaxID=2965509 RepID=A0ABQ5MM24_9FLAO|nr:hypothetical protein Y10_28140 [Neptunitalea sp. Y10]